MRVVLVGMNHKTAPIQLRERAALSGDALGEALRRLHTTLERPREAQETPRERPEGVILSTCNRLEIYAAVDEDASDVTSQIIAFLAETGGFAEGSLTSYLYCMETEQAVRHLMRVATGLDSMVLGEPQILGQVTEAFEAAMAAGTVGPVLSALFRQAIHTGKRARTETAIGRRATTVSHAAVTLASQVLGSIHGRRVLLIGAGEMAQVAARHLASAGASALQVTNRTYERAESLARRVGGLPVAWDRMEEALAWADIVLTSTGASQAIIDVEIVQRVMRTRPDRPLFFIDIAVPRNVEPQVGEIPNVYRYDIDDLQTIVDTNLSERQREIPKVEAIIAEEAEEYLAWLRERAVVPVLRELRAKAEAIAEAELQRALRRLPNLTDAERRVIATLSHRIVNKLLHEPTVRLKAYASNGHGDGYERALRDLFVLNGQYRGG